VDGPSKVIIRPSKKKKKGKEEQKTFQFILSPFHGLILHLMQAYSPALAPFLSSLLPMS